MRTDAACDELLDDLAGDHWGRVSVGWYDTSRLVALAPWLAGHRARIEFLCRTQHPAGQWGGPGGYALVPTLSATAALLTELRRAGSRQPPERRPPDRLTAERLAPDRLTADRLTAERITAAVTGGLRALHRWLRPGAPALAVPDTIGVELIVPALVEELAELVDWLRLPDGFDRRLLAGARQRFADRALPAKSWACLEVFGAAAAGARFVRPAGGAVGCSAAATAAWLGDPPEHRPSGHPEAVRFLETLQQRGGGPVPGVTPITYFEAAWVLNSLATAGVPRSVPAAVLDRLAEGLADDGAPAAPGLPPDADDTAAVLAALLRHGRVHPPDRLLRYRTDGYFTCFPDERNPSVSTNAHVLETLALYLAHQPRLRSRLAGPAAAAARWLLDRQQADGSWSDKWHASPYYATACCVLALALSGQPHANAAIARARVWVRDTQRPDGGWGRWRSTVEETGYAVQILALPRPAPAALPAAVRRGCDYLADPPPLAEQPPLWHAKDLYTPVTVVRATRLAALHLGSARMQDQPRAGARA